MDIPNVKGLELRNVKLDFGIEHLKIEADIYFNDVKIAELLDDGWCDDIYIEWKNQTCKRKFKNLFEKEVLNKLLIMNRKYSSINIKPGLYQLSYLI